jgi:hypothetical protein
MDKIKYPKSIGHPLFILKYSEPIGNNLYTNDSREVSLTFKISLQRYYFTIFSSLIPIL